MARWCAPLLLCCLACGGKHGSAGGGGAGAGHAGMGTGGRAGSAGSLPPDAGGADGGLCTYDPDAGPVADCPSDVPSACDGAAPSYKDSVSQTLASRCGACHRVGGMAPDKPFDTYAHVYKVRRTILFELSVCKMPLACAPQPTLAEREELLKWLVCGAPDN